MAKLVAEVDRNSPGRRRTHCLSRSANFSAAAASTTSLFIRKRACGAVTVRVRTGHGARPSSTSNAWRNSGTTSRFGRVTRGSCKRHAASGCARRHHCHAPRRPMGSKDGPPTVEVQVTRPAAADRIPDRLSFEATEPKAPEMIIGADRPQLPPVADWQASTGRGSQLVGRRTSRSSDGSPSSGSRGRRTRLASQSSRGGFVRLPGQPAEVARRSGASPLAEVPLPEPVDRHAGEHRILGSRSASQRRPRSAPHGNRSRAGQTASRAGPLDPVRAGQESPLVRM